MPRSRTSGLFETKLALTLFHLEFFKDADTTAVEPFKADTSAANEMKWLGEKKSNILRKCAVIIEWVIRPDGNPDVQVSGINSFGRRERY